MDQPIKSPFHYLPQPPRGNAETLQTTSPSFLEEFARNSSRCTSYHNKSSLADPFGRPRLFHHKFHLGFIKKNLHRGLEIRTTIISHSNSLSSSNVTILVLVTLSSLSFGWAYPQLGRRYTVEQPIKNAFVYHYY